MNDVEHPDLKDSSLCILTNNTYFYTNSFPNTLYMKILKMPTWKTEIFQLAIALILLVTSSQAVFAQEHIVPLGSNATIQEYLNRHPTENFHRVGAADTIILPFIDDFARQGIYPSDSLWEDNDVFINSTFADSPFTIGVATFDGLDYAGRPHDSLSSSDAISDYLTSRPIDLSGLQGNTSVWLSFFYQPQGLGDIPESNDSLVLQFKDTSGNWIRQWAVEGKPDTAFTRVNINLLGNAFLYKGFQFRFYNIATVNGNRDHWHLDYVILNKNTVANDSIRDNSFINNKGSLLSEYSAMPYKHYASLSNPTAAMVPEIVDSVRNINYGGTSITYVAEIYNEQGFVQFASTPSTQGSASLSDIEFITPLNYTFPSNLTVDSTSFLLKTYFSQPGINSNAHNDTSYHMQYFHNYYAYDDGSAEVAYGVTGNTDVKMAYQFDVKMADTLRGVQIYFNPVGLNVHTKLFQLAYWSSVSVAGNTDQLVYRMINQKPANIDSINGFATYLFDELLVVQPGLAYVGIIQNEPQTIYGIGLDRNTDSRSKMFYHVDGFWYQTQVRGSWMIRPIFGDTLGSLVSVNELSYELLPFSVFPNPAGELVEIQLGSASAENHSFEIVNLLGSTIMAGEFHNSVKINISSISKGLYFIRLKNLKNGSVASRKLLIDK